MSDAKAALAPTQALLDGVSSFFDGVMADSLLSLYFMNTDLEKHKERFALYLAHVLNNSEPNYPGRNAHQAHVGRGIMDEAADKFVDGVVQKLINSGLPDDDVTKIEQKLSDMKELVCDVFAPAKMHTYTPQRMG